MVAGHGGPSSARPSSRATTRAAARSLAHGTSVKLTVPNELHSPTARNTAPYPEGRTAAGPGAVAPPAGPVPRETPPLPSAPSPAGLWHPVSSTAHPADRAHSARTAALPRIAIPRIPRPA